MLQSKEELNAIVLLFQPIIRLIGLLQAVSLSSDAIDS